MIRAHEGRPSGWRAAPAVVLLVLLAISAAGAAPRPTAASTPAAPVRSDTATASGVYRGAPLERLLVRVAAVVESGLGEAEQQRVRDGALTLGPSGFFEDRPASVSFTFDVRARGQLHRLDVRLSTVDFEHVDVHFVTPDSTLVAAIRGAIREAHLASLIPLERARIAVEELSVEEGRPPIVVLAMTTEREFGCLGYEIETRLERRGDTLALHADGVAGPGGLCPSAVGPARTWRAIDVAPGSHLLAVSYRGDTNSFALAVTDSSLALATRHATFLTADERLRWRTPANSFVLTCYSGGGPDALCPDLHQWVARQPGIAPVARDGSGLRSFAAGEEDHDAREYRYTADDALRSVRECVGSIGPRIRGVVGVWVQFETWLGERMMMVPERSDHEPRVERPVSVTQSPECGRTPPLRQYERDADLPAV